MLHRLQSRYAPYIFLAPFLATFTVFGLYPLIRSLVLAFYMTAGPQASTFSGFGNFTVMLRDPDFHTAVWNTTRFAFYSVFLQLPLSLGLALLLNHQGVRARSFFRLAFFSPHLVGAVFVGVLFPVLFAPNRGLVNRFLFPLGVVSIDRDWLGEPGYVMPAIVIATLWMYVGYNAIYFLAALQAVDKDLYEAATVDGANSWQQFLHVTVPGIWHVAVFVVVLSTIGSFQLFELPYMMLNGAAGPNNAGLTIVMYLYQNGFVTGDLGYAAAVGWVLALGVMAVGVVQMWLSGSFRKEA